MHASWYSRCTTPLGNTQCAALGLWAGKGRGNCVWAQRNAQAARRHWPPTHAAPQRDLPVQADAAGCGSDRHQVALRLALTACAALPCAPRRDSSSGSGSAVGGLACLHVLRWQPGVALLLLLRAWKGRGLV